MSNTGILDKKGKFKLNAGTAGGILLGLCLSCMFYGIMHYIHDEAIAHPAVIMALPLAGIAWILLMIPIFMYTTYQDDFKHLTPLIPTHYIQIARKCLRALKDNNFKVAEKDL